MMGYTILEMDKLPEVLKKSCKINLEHTPSQPSNFINLVQRTDQCGYITNNFFPSKPRWVTCLVFTTGILMITVSAVSIGVFIGYTYCYIEHRTGIRTGNLTRSTNFQILQVPLIESEESRYNKTINGAMLSSVLVSKILKIGHVLMEEETGCQPWQHESHAFDNNVI